MNIDNVKLFKCLGDKSRLSILSNLINEPMYVELLAERLNLTPSTVSFHLKKMEEVGLVHSKKEQYYMIYEIDEQLLNMSLSDFIHQENSEEKMQREREEKYRSKVISSFFQYGKLKSIPVQRKKARIVYEEILKAFEPNRKYTEREVNIIIADYHDDFCTIRRDMISENLLEREGNIYWVKDNNSNDKNPLQYYLL